MKRKEILDQITDVDKCSNSSVDFTSMTEQELRLHLKNCGVNTKIRNREKLMSLIASLNI